MKIRTIAFRNLRRNKRRTFISILAIMLAAVFVTIMFTFGEGLKKDLVNVFQSFQSGEIRLTDKEYKENDVFNVMPVDLLNADEAIKAISGLPEFKVATERTSFATAYFKDGQTFPAIGFGVDFENEKYFLDPAKFLTEGVLPANDSRDILISATFAEQGDLKVGDRITLSTMTRPYTGISPNGMTFRISGIIRITVSGLSGPLIFAPNDAVKRWIRLPGGATTVLLKVNGPIDKALAAFKNVLSKNADFSNVVAKSWDQIGDTAYLVAMYNTMFYFMAVIFFALASTVIINTVIMLIFERRKEVGTLSAMGMDEGKIVRMFFLEAIYMSVFGAIAGILVGVAAAIGLDSAHLDIGGVIGEIDINITTVLRFKVNWASTVVVFIVSVVVAGAASILPARKAAKIEPVEALRDE